MDGSAIRTREQTTGRLRGKGHTGGYYSETRPAPTVPDAQLEPAWD